MTSRPTVEPAGVSEERLTDHELRELHSELCELPFYSVKSRPHRSRIAVAELLAARQQLAEMRGAWLPFPQNVPKCALGIGRDSRYIVWIETDGGMAYWGVRQYSLNVEKGADDRDWRWCSGSQPTDGRVTHFMEGPSNPNIAAALAPTSQPSRETCPMCIGDKVVLDEPCDECDGTGTVAAQPSRGKCEVPTSNDINVAAQAACGKERPHLGIQCEYSFRTGFREGANWLYDRFDCAQPERQGATPFDQIKAAMQADDAYAWSWHCNIAMPMLDAKQGLTHQQANECAAAVMEHMFRIDVRKSREWQATFKQPDAERPSPPQDDIVAGLRESARALRHDLYVNKLDCAAAIDRAIAALGEKGAK